MKRIIAGVIVAIPLMTTFATKASASEVIVHPGFHSVASKPEFIARAKRRVYVPGHFVYMNHHRTYVKAHYEYRY
ncbi:MAG: hypothetical protein PUP91_33565 [Rhizonema sp. PD37]|nr:hypothetical protein [Rhizonema sp. PD37]